MNILFLDQFSDLGGAQRCLLDLLPAVIERGWRAHVAAPGEIALLELALPVRPRDRAALGRRLRLVVLDLERVAARLLEVHRAREVLAAGKKIF